ncbi:MAG TPA: COX15/CtaA family protein [Acidimicrobiales bacterium]|nr:COX15/CtaA family protein [Acidimicrobiales bacterium]
MHRISPGVYRKVTLAALVALGVIVVTGAAVRLTGSGLGCPDWPNCDPGHLSPHGNTGYHGVVEYVNRLFTGLVSVLVIVAVLGSLARRPRRADLTWLSVGLVVGVLAQIVLGGLVVIFGLSPPWVIAHFVVSMFLVADAVVLHHRAGLPDGRRTVTAVAPSVRKMGWVLLAACAVVIATGTIVTGAGPHGGDEDVHRLGIAITDAARIHGIAENIFLVAVLVTLWLLSRTGAPAHIRHNGNVLLAVLFGQATVGYIQYFSGVPVVLVAVHIVGAVVVWSATLFFVLGLRVPAPEPVPERELVELRG